MFGVEGALILAGAVIFLKTAPALKYMVSALVVCLIIFQLTNFLLPPPENASLLALSA